MLLYKTHLLGNGKQGIVTHGSLLLKMIFPLVGNIICFCVLVSKNLFLCSCVEKSILLFLCRKKICSFVVSRK